MDIMACWFLPRQDAYLPNLGYSPASFQMYRLITAGMHAPSLRRGRPQTWPTRSEYMWTYTREELPAPPYPLQMRTPDLHTLTGELGFGCVVEHMTINATC